MKAAMATGAGIMAIAVVAACLEPLARPAQAAYPGRNGKIAFTSNRVTPDNPEGDFEIFSMNSDGGDVVQLTKNAVDDATPVWSPNGKEIAFLSDRDGTEDIFTMSAKGADQTNITANVAKDADPDWQSQPH